MKNIDDDLVRYINREVSWLEFNARVLDEAADIGNPLLERLKFLAIFSSNLDEFFMVRVAAVRRQAEAGKTLPGYDPVGLLKRLDDRIRTLVGRQYRYLNQDIFPALAEEGIHLVQFNELETGFKANLNKYFQKQILPVLTPIGIDQSHPFPLLKNLGLHLLVRLQKKDEKKDSFAIVEVPSIISRFIQTNDPSGKVYVTAEELIAANLDLLFSGCNIKESSLFRITRDMDFSFDEERVADLLSELEVELQKSTRRRIIRLEISSSTGGKSRNFLEKNFHVKSKNIYSVPGLLNLNDLFAICRDKSFPKLLDPPLNPLPSNSIDPETPILDSIKKNGPFLLHHPYESFLPVIKMLEEAAVDPKVLAIKQTLYRVSGNSPIIRALAKAALNGKQVTVLIELKARFDEENNIVWARELAEAGAHVVYGIAGLKVHCKSLLIIRKEDDGIQRYVHLGTGNYNDTTAKLYTDIGLMSCDNLLAADVSALFNVITGFSQPPIWNKIMVAPFNLRSRLVHLIKRESDISTKENPGHIIIKINSLIDSGMIDCLYEAAENHVKIDLIVRGICGINPTSIGKVGKNINVISILDRFLEHPRIYYFKNNDTNEYYLGSADMMPRNLDRRIELLFPIRREELKQELQLILDMALQDKRKGRKMVGPNNFSRTVKAHKKYEKTRSQARLYNFYKERYERYEEALKLQREIKVFKNDEEPQI
jgi:polyphosphate kinase